MRIVAGTFGGRTLIAPKGKHTRPTTDRVREALMSSIGSALGDFTGLSVLDAFAGSGALGLEALSRGADRVLFFEKQTAALRALKTNIEALGINCRQASVCQADVFKQSPLQAAGPFDLVFLDPPYDTAVPAITALLDRLAAEGAIAEGALISYEHAKRADSEVSEAFDPLQWEPISHKSYGDTAIDILRFEKASKA